jgi:hypothetical protein
VAVASQVDGRLGPDLAEVSRDEDAHRVTARAPRAARPRPSARAPR